MRVEEHAKDQLVKARHVNELRQIEAEKGTREADRALYIKEDLTSACDHGLWNSRSAEVTTYFSTNYVI